ncbi:MAG: Spy/CpxP family protein refolding chaperone [bacterium]
MSRLAATLAIAGAFAIGSMAHAQQPDRGAGRPQRAAPNAAPRGAPMGPPMGGGPMGGSPMDVASRFLAQTGELKLSDQQVTRLAAIARRSAEHRQVLRASLDSMRPARFGPPGTQRDSVRRQGLPPAALTLATRMRDQAHLDLRDALAVLTPDQLATAWGMMTSRGSGGRPGAMGGRTFRPTQFRPTTRGR